MDTKLSSSHKNMEKFSSHPLLQKRPRFVSSLNEFEVFLKITLDDLSAKINIIKRKGLIDKHKKCHTNVRHSRNISIRQFRNQ